MHVLSVATVEESIAGLGYGVARRVCCQLVVNERIVTVGDVEALKTCLEGGQSIFQSELLVLLVSEPNPLQRCLPVERRLIKLNFCGFRPSLGHGRHCDVAKVHKALRCAGNRACSIVRVEC